MQCLLCDDIVTSRLVLIAITPEMLQSEQRDDHRLGELLHASIPSNWPPVDWEPHVLAILLKQFELYPDQIGWLRHIVLPHEEGSRTLIGSVGAFWRESSPNECEIGYSILPPHEGQGLATEATQALIDCLRRNSHLAHVSLTSIFANTFPRLKGSIRVMEKCGLAFEGDGQEEGTIRYRLNL